MSWINNTLSSSIGRKIIMAVTGLFLCSFLVVHLIGNFQLFKGDGGLAFNTYSHFMSTNPMIRVAEIILVAGFGFHIYEALVLTRRNQSARGNQKYVVDHIGQNSDWKSRNMGVLGSVILVFLIVHLYNFYYRYHYEPLPFDSQNNKNLYAVVMTSFQTWWYVALYVLAQVALCYHLLHGFASGFQTLGLNHRKYTPVIKAVGYAFSIIVCAGFAAMPLYFFIFKS